MAVRNLVVVFLAVCLQLSVQGYVLKSECPLGNIEERLDGRYCCLTIQTKDCYKISPTQTYNPTSSLLQLFGDEGVKGQGQQPQNDNVSGRKDYRSYTANTPLNKPGSKPISVYDDVQAAIVKRLQSQQPQNDNLNNKEVRRASDAAAAISDEVKAAIVRRLQNQQPQNDNLNNKEVRRASDTANTAPAPALSDEVEAAIVRRLQNQPAQKDTSEGLSLEQIRKRIEEYLRNRKNQPGSGKQSDTDGKKLDDDDYYGYGYGYPWGGYGYGYPSYFY